MRHHESVTRRLLTSACALLAALAAASCESTTQVGSECRDGVCPRADLVTSRSCVLSATYAELAITRLANDDPAEALGQICLPRPLPVDSQGQVDCRVHWRLGEAESVPGSAEPSPEQCSDLPFLEHAGSGHATNVCVVEQITAAQAAEGDVDGWFYAGEGTRVAECGPVTLGGQAVSFTLGAVPRSGVVVEVVCSRVEAADGDGVLVDVAASECGELPEESGNDDVGAACLPSGIPAGGFADTEAHLEVGSDQCESEACLVYRLRGYPDPECTEDREAGILCASEEQVEDHAYCTCRCDGPEGDPGPLCDCSDGFTCLPVFEDGPPGLSGSYCVKDGTFTG